MQILGDVGHFVGYTDAEPVAVCRTIDSFDETRLPLDSMEGAEDCGTAYSLNKRARTEDYEDESYFENPNGNNAAFVWMIFGYSRLPISLISYLREQ